MLSQLLSELTRNKTCRCDYTNGIGQTGCRTKGWKLFFLNIEMLVQRLTGCHFVSKQKYRMSFVREKQIIEWTKFEVMFEMTLLLHGSLPSSQDSPLQFPRSVPTFSHVKIDLVRFVSAFGTYDRATTSLLEPLIHFLIWY
jgi:hypothetical protein